MNKKPWENYKQYTFKKKPIYDFLKRGFDIVGSFLFIVLFSWLLLILGVVVCLTSPGGPFYGHVRYEKDGKTFKVLKFRTMKKDDRPLEEQLTAEQLKEFQINYKLEDDPRMTKFGKILRKTSLDELPQVFNIFIGQMSFIGPRPIVKNEIVRFGDNKDLLLKVKPGLTGYWGSHGRNTTSYQERIEMELYYVCNRSIALDINILFNTVISVFTQKGAA